MTASQPRRRTRSKKRKLIYALLTVFVLFGVATGVYVYRLIDAVVDAEQAAVVPLPTRSTGFGASGNPTMVPTVPGPTQTPGAPGSIVAGTNLTAVPTLPTQGTSTPAVPGPSATADQPTNTATTSPTPDPNATATIDPYLPLPTAEDVSHFDVLSDLWGAVAADDPGTSAVWGGKRSINLLLLGVDRRADGGDQNADVIMIVHVDLINSKVSSVSIPRDLLVDIPGIGADKINSAYNYGHQADPYNKAAGVAKMRDTIESVFQIPIDGYVLVDFNGFVDVVDAMGGVTLNVPSLLIDDNYPTADYGTETVTFLPGEQHMSGERALKYVRTRHQDSDDGRRERQIQVLRGLFVQAKSAESLTNGFKIISALGGAVQTSFSTEQQLTLAKLGYGMQDDDIYTASMGSPLITGGYIASGAWVYQGDLAQIRTWVIANLATNPQPIAAGTSGSSTATEFPITPTAEIASP
ncbi:MAG TPA: LCP family protein [Thermomicrobiales bacterium]|nr:LCP family protein [Thermomicrobiales bacterium]